MNVYEILEMYKNLNTKDKFKFDREYKRIKIQEEIEIQNAKKELKDSLKNLVDDDGNPYISDEWLDKNF